MTMAGSSFLPLIPPGAGLHLNPGWKATIELSADEVASLRPATGPLN
jgi:hypothetical protein